MAESQNILAITGSLRMTNDKDIKQENQKPLESQMDLIAQIQEAADKSFETPDTSVDKALQHVLGQFIGGSFLLVSGKIEDYESNITSQDYGTLIISNHSDTSGGNISVDDVAVIIDAYEYITEDELGAAYQKIAEAKSLKRNSPEPANDAGETDMKLGVIFIKDTHLGLEEISNQIGILCKNIPSELWPDMVAIHNKGIISYVAHFPGDTSIGDFFLPASEPQRASIVPIYVIRTAWSAPYK